MAYSSLSRAQLSFDYLHANSTTHEFLFGALAELLDNARDASATKINIYTVADPSLRGGYMVCFLDDGDGMDPNETSDIIMFGKSTKRTTDRQHIGMYGNGLKSGSMRMGNDLILFTKKSTSMSCLLLSRTFHEEEGIDEVIVPLPSFDISTRCLLDKSSTAKERHNTEMELIFKYSPFRTEQHLFSQFDLIEGNSGTLVVIFNLKLLDDGITELDISSDPRDIVLSNTEPDGPDDGLLPELRSFRAYASVLYVEPRMRIYIQGKKVHTKRLTSCLYKPRFYQYSSNRFRNRAEAEAKKAQQEALSADNKARESESKAKNLEIKFGSTLSKEQRIELRKMQTTAAEYRREADVRRQVADRKSRALKEPRTLNFIFGVNLDNRSHDGVFVYNCSRLIKLYEKVGPQTEGGVYCSGIVGVVNVPYLVLEPTHNKQDFADAKEFRHLMKMMGEHMIQYWKDINIAQQGVTRFWEGYGYVSSRWRDPPSADIKYIRKRAMQINTTLQCDSCLKWRILPFNSSDVDREFPDNWQCSMNPDHQHNKCTVPEQKLNILEGYLRKEVKSQDEKKKDLQEEIRKKTMMLSSLNKCHVVLSSRDAAIDDAAKRVKVDMMLPPDLPPTPPPRKAAIASRQDVKSSAASFHRPSTPTTRSRPTAVRASLPKSIKASQAKSLPEETTHKHLPCISTRSRPIGSVKQEVNAAKERAHHFSREPSLPSRKRVAASGIVSSIGSRRTTHSQSAKNEDVSSSGAESVVPLYDEMSADTEPIKKRSKVLQSPVHKSTTGGGSSKTAVKAVTSTADSTPMRVAVGKTKMVQEKINKKPPPGVFMSSVDVEAQEASQSDMAVDTVSSANDSEDEPVKNGDVKVIVGARVEAVITDKWHSGTVVKANADGGRWRVKFDSYPKDKNDKWYAKGTSDIRFLPDKMQSIIKKANFAPNAKSPIQEGSETPSSSTSTSTAATTAQYIEIANGYRTCLRYFLPPQWVMNKETILQMSLQELSEFPLDEFFDHYERGLRRLVSNFQTEASTRKSEAELAKDKLSSIRKLIVKLIKSTNEEVDVDPEADGDQVDELLLFCVRQAVQS